MLQHEQVVVSYEQRKIKGPDFSDPIIYHLNLYTLYYIEINKGKKKRKVILQKDDENYKDGKICKKTSKNIL